MKQSLKRWVIVALTAVLVMGLMGAVSAQRSDNSLETSSEQSAALVARQVGAQSPARQVVSPAIQPATLKGESTSEIVVSEVASATLEASVSEIDSDVNERALESDTAELAQAIPDDVSVTTTTAVPFRPVAPTPGSTVAPSPAAEGSVAAPSSTSPPASRPATTTTSTTTTTTTTAPAPLDGRYSVAQVIFGTIAGGDGSNPNEESPMGLHEAPLYLPQGWNWAQGPTRNSQWGNLAANQFAEWRCAVIPEFGHTPDVPFRINVRNGAYYQFANNSWSKAFDVNLDSPDHGAYLGRAGQLNQDPFSSGGPGRIEWRQEPDGSFSAPWNAEALMMHFWASQRQSPLPGQTAEFLTSELRLQQPDGQQVDLSEVRVLFQCGIDYYNTTGGQGTQVPGPGIATYQVASSEWTSGLWVTLPGDVPAASTGDFRTWLEANLPPNVRR